MSDTLQNRIAAWAMACFGAEHAGNVRERALCFGEEALEAIQAAGITESEAHALVSSVFRKPVGTLPGEVGDVMIELSAMCSAAGISTTDQGERRLADVTARIEEVRARHVVKRSRRAIPPHTIEEA